MSKLFVRNEAAGVSVPFLRGILVRSLQNVGLDFESAYSIATTVRDELREQDEITCDALRQHVLGHLSDYDEEIVGRYGKCLLPAAPIVVRYDEANTAHYSRGRQRLGLLCAALSPDEAAAVAAQIHSQLVESGVTEVDHHDLRRLTYDKVLDTLGEKPAQRYLAWQAFRQSRRSMIVLLGGATGTGKSTIAAQLSHVLDIVRTQSTDMLREAMRMMIPERLMPALHASTFDAWETLPMQGSASFDERIARGYLAQTEALAVSCSAVAQRALKERLSVIIEGIHVHPRLLSHIDADNDAIVVPAMLNILKPKDLKRRLRGRGRDAPDRRAERYLENFDAIWALQTFLLGEADHAGVPLIPNYDVDVTVRDVILAILRKLRSELDVSPETVLGTATKAG